jgi:hypothetical protein
MLSLAAAALATGCGSASPGGSAVTAPAAGDAGAAITIQAPADGSRLKAKASKSGALRARVRIRGRARAGSAVFLSAGCRPTPCGAQARAGADGRWAATLALTAPRAGRFVAIDANAQRDVVASGSAVATVELVGPAPARARRRTAGSGSSAAARGDAAATRAPARRSLPRDVLVIGDSLAVGFEQPLKAALPGWRVRVDGRIGRPLSEGMGILAGQSSPPAILAFSLFTNDGPRETPALEAAVRATATRPGGCAVWATVVRPPLAGVSYDGANALLRGLANDPELALGLQVVDWAAEVAQSPSLLAGDGVHATPAGYRVLGQLYAAAITSCAGAG